MAFHKFSYTDFIPTPFLLTLSCWSGMTQQLSSYARSLSQTGEGSEPVWSYTKCRGVEKQPEENAIRALSHCSLPASFSLSPSLFISCFQYKSFVGKYILQIALCEEPWKRRLAVSGWSAHRYMQPGGKRHKLLKWGIFENILDPTFCYLTAWFDFVIL